jgi:hypothetical protein
LKRSLAMAVMMLCLLGASRARGRWFCSGDFDPEQAGDHFFEERAERGRTEAISPKRQAAFMCRVARSAPLRTLAPTHHIRISSCLG